jgi:hypothetical protein
MAFDCREFRMDRSIRHDREHSLAFAVLKGGCPVNRTLQELDSLRLMCCVRATETRENCELL